MKFSSIVLIIGVLVGIAGAMLIPAQTDAGRALIFLIALLVVALLVQVGELLAKIVLRAK